MPNICNVSPKFAEVRRGMHRVALFDVDSRIPNLALMKLSAYYRTPGWEVVLATKPVRIDEIIYRYNNKHCIQRYLSNSACLRRDLYPSFK